MLKNFVSIVYVQVKKKMHINGHSQNHAYSPNVVLIQQLYHCYALVIFDTMITPYYDSFIPGPSHMAWEWG